MITFTATIWVKRRDGLYDCVQEGEVRIESLSPLGGVLQFTNASLTIERIEAENLTNPAPSDML